MQIRHFLSHISSLFLFFFCKNFASEHSCSRVFISRMTIGIFQLIEKYSNEAFLVSNQIFCFHKKIGALTNLKDLDSNMKIICSNSSLKIPKKSIFGFKFKEFYFCKQLWILSNLVALISNVTVFFENGKT